MPIDESCQKRGATDCRYSATRTILGAIWIGGRQIETLAECYRAHRDQRWGKDGARRGCHKCSAQRVRRRWCRGGRVQRPTAPIPNLLAGDRRLRNTNRDGGGQLRCRKCQRSKQLLDDWTTNHNLSEALSIEWNQIAVLKQNERGQHKIMYTWNRCNPACPFSSFLVSTVKCEHVQLILNDITCSLWSLS